MISLAICPPYFQSLQQPPSAAIVFGEYLLDCLPPGEVLAGGSVTFTKRGQLIIQGVDSGATADVDALLEPWTLVRTAPVRTFPSAQVKVRARSRDWGDRRSWGR
jgi:hypothetical protein